MNETMPAKRRYLPDLFQSRGYRKGAEIGTWLGEYAACILSRSAVDKLYCIDPWDGTGMSVDFDGDEVMHKCRERLAPFGDRARIIRAASPHCAPLFSPGALDFVYIDAKHDYESAAADIRAWLPIVRAGGVLAGHDYSNRCGKGVKRAVLEAFPETAVNVTADERCASWWVEVE